MAGLAAVQQRGDYEAEERAASDDAQLIATARLPTSYATDDGAGLSIAAPVLAEVVADS